VLVFVSGWRPAAGGSWRTSSPRRAPGVTVRWGPAQDRPGRTSRSPIRRCWWRSSGTRETWVETTP